MGGRFVRAGLFMKKILLISLAVLTMFTAPQAAKADYFVWRDAGSGMSLTFPDTWQVVSNADPDDVLTVMAPAGRANAQCRVRARADARYAIYPPRFDWAIQKVDFSYDFWMRYLGEYDDAQILTSQNGAGLGRGYAGYAAASYKSPVPGPYMNRRGLLFASLYHNNVYILECSSHEDAFEDWKGAFLSVAKSVDFRKINNSLMTGNYNDFRGGRRILFPEYHGKREDYYYP